MNDLETRDEKQLGQMISLASDLVEKKYLNELSEQPIVPLPESLQKLTFQKNVRLFKLNRLVIDGQENNLEKLLSVYYTLGDLESSLILVLNSDGQKVDYYLGTRSSHVVQSVVTAKEVLEKSFIGQYPGSELENIRNSQAEELIENVLNSNGGKHGPVISSVSGIPSWKGDSSTKFVQGIEKLIDAMKGEAFSAILIADPVTPAQVANIRRGYENLYSQLVPFAHSELSFGANDSQAISDGISKGFTETMTESLTTSKSYTKGESTSTSVSTNDSKTTNPGAIIGAIGAVAGSVVPGLGTLAGGIIGGAIGAAASAVIGSRTTGSSHSESKNTNLTESEGSAQLQGKSESNSFTENKMETLTVGHSRQLQIRFENKTVTNLLAKIDGQLERLQSSEDFGLWNCGVYFVAPTQRTALVASSTFKSLMRGENSAVETSFLNIWDPERSESAQEVSRYLQKLSHPLLEWKTDTGLPMPYVTPSSLLNGQELSLQLGLPQKSVHGLPVMTTADFGRNVITLDSMVESREKLSLGNIFHRAQIEQSEVELDLQSLAMHTLVTGATGAGKSNAIYQLLKELYGKGIRFLVIEPAKGEYKQVWGGVSGVHVYGTNPYHAPLLRINPFRFPEGIHVLEHIDRLIEMINAAWPMYAAMPAILKEAIERMYERKGWGLHDSLYYGSEPQYPTFRDLLRVLPEVIAESGYSEEVTSNYVGALVTRVKSMTNGLIGQIFSDEEIENEQLFDQSCIVDLSRLGSVETKSLLMGILFLRLQEHRMTNADGMNQRLKHVTVLEEAHHLLRRTSSEQSQEGANLQGKSVEMIANAIAEMRTYGEGFIIADQSPNLLDLAVIRNTNTKLMLRLPERSDRMEVGKSMALTDEQIDEVPKLKTGVAVVYQNNWVEAVLCQVEEFKDVKPFSYQAPTIVKSVERRMVNDLLILLLNCRVAEEQRVDLSAIDPEPLRDWLLKSSYDWETKVILLQNLQQYQTKSTASLWEQEQFDTLARIVTGLVEGRGLLQQARTALHFDEWNQFVSSFLCAKVDIAQQRPYADAMIQCMLAHRTAEDESFQDFYLAWVEDVRARRGGFL